MAPVPSLKVRIPDHLPGAIARPDLQAQVDRGEGKALTVLVGPPGYGKTVLLADWARRRDVAWLSLDEDDDAPGRFWPTIVAALDVDVAARQAAGADAHVRRLVDRWTGRRWSPGDGFEFVAELLEVAQRAAAPLELVLDGSEHLHDPEILNGLKVLLHAPQDSVRLLLAGRADPALPIARLRLEGRLCELRADDLRFTVEETDRLLRDAGVHLDPVQIMLLHERTGGWAAGLRLAALRLREHPDPSGFLARLPHDRAIAEYLDTEILVHLSDAERNLLGLVSVADPVPAALAVALSGRDDAGDVLDRLGRRTGLLTATDRTRAEYRTQELLRSYLSVDLYRHGHREVEVLHGRAARWWTDRGRCAQALRHAQMAGETGLLTGLLNRWAVELAARGEHAVLLNPPAALDGDGPFLLSSAVAHLGQGRHAVAARALHRVRPVGDVSAELAAYRLAVGRLAGAPGLEPEADEWTPDEPALAAMCLLGRGAARLFSSVAAAAGDLHGAADLAASHGFAFVQAQCRNLLAVADWLRGDLVHAVEHAAAGTDSRPGSPWSAAAQAAAAHALFLRGFPQHAQALCATSLSTESAVPAVRYSLHTVRGAARFADGDRESGLEEMRHARAELGAASAPAAVCAAGALLEQQAALALGHPAAASSALGWLAARVPASAELAVGRARAEAAAGRLDAARAIARPLLRGEADVAALPCTLVDAWVIETNAACAAGDRTGARRALRTALALAVPMDAVQPFAALDDLAGELLMDVRGGGSHSSAAFSARASTVQARSTPPSPIGFSGRELDVLAKLPSLLSLDDIALELGVSVNTVKTHLRSIYAKLGVTGRRAAVLAAHGRRALA